MSLQGIQKHKERLSAEINWQEDGKAQEHLMTLGLILHNRYRQ